MSSGSPACEIRKGLYIGGLVGLDTVSDLGVTHILSVVNDMPELATRLYKLSMKHYLIDMPDMPEANLLPYFQPAFQFIRTALASSGKVFVHCQAGVSRSASVVLAYLMATEKTSVQSALASIRKAYPYANPNEGFLQQLQLWQDMGYSFKPEQAGYNLVTMRQLAMRYDAGEGLASIATNLAVPSEATSQGMLYRCRKCRRLLATQNNVVPVTEGPGSSAFKYRKRGKGVAEQGEDRGSLWLEPMAWMQQLSDGETQGKLYCPSCKARLGSYNWAGSQSESGAWITPAFQLHHAKIDAMSAQAAAPLNIRRPFFGQSQAVSLEKESMAESSNGPTTVDLEPSQQQAQESVQLISLDEAVTPVDAARTVSDAAHAAAQINAGMTRPTNVPGNDHRPPVIPQPP